MKLSIVTLSFNQGKFLEEAILSIINQKDVVVEYIVVDPGSTDGSRQIIEKYRNIVKHIIYEPDKGPSDGLNKGFSMATGDIFGYVNADDILLPFTLSKVSRYFTGHPKADVISGHGYVINGKGEIVQKIFSHKLSSNKFHLQRFTSGYSILVQPSTFFRKSTYNKTNGFDLNYRIMWDAAIAIDFALLGARFKVVDDYWSSFRVYSGSITGSGAHQDERSKQVFCNLQKRVGIKPLTNIESQFVRILGWISQPKLLLLRLLDNIVHPKRII